MDIFYVCLAGFLLNCVGLVFALWVMFAKVNRPITWTKFNFMVGACLLNIVGLIMNGYGMWRWAQ